MGHSGGMLTTKPLPVDLVAAFPELELRTTVRLHPREGSAAVWESKMGGEFPWPELYPWPICSVHADPLQPVLQLRCEDVPELGCPEGKDLFQLLWCPRDHEEPVFVPLSQIFWWETGELSEQVRAPAPAPDADPDYLPRPCRFFPERVVELPDPDELSPQTVERINSWIVEHIDSLLVDDRVYDNLLDHAYEYVFSNAPGTKVGGFPQWLQWPEYPMCAQGHTMEHLLTVADEDFGPGWHWMPQEERHLWGGPHQFEVLFAPGLLLAGNLYVFICRDCDGWPMQTVFQT